MASSLEPKIFTPSFAQDDESPMDKGFGVFGCSHYRRRCKIIAPCCDEVFDCRHCHNDVKNLLEMDPRDRHDLPRHEMKRVICSLCNTEQDVQQICIKCGVCMGKYYCSTCKFFDDDVSKKQYHCVKCGICRVGGQENFFHCDRCDCCYSTWLKDSHICVERAMHQNCPICFEYLFDTTKEMIVLLCGHTMHLECLKEMRRHFRYSCPLCSKSFCDMSHVWQKFDEEVAATSMPPMYQNRKVWILCNDCGEKSEVNFHILAQKCVRCASYNTRQIQHDGASSSSRITEMVR